MKCPLCQHEGLDASVNVCPSCKADLSAYHALDVIESSFKKQKKTIEGRIKDVLAVRIIPQFRQS